jgi:predicted enzyme related to lactoylglutathione lyase
MANPFAHIELTTGDLAKAKKFYKKLFDWKLTDTPMGSDGGVYTMIAPGKGPGGGMQAQPMPGAPITWLPYVEVDDVKKSLAKAEKGGAKVVLPVMDIGKNGVIGIFVDPGGAMLGVWSKAKPAPGKKAKKASKKK